MIPQVISGLGRALGTWVDVTSRRAGWTVITFAVLTALLLQYAVTNLGVNTNTADMISERLPWRRAFIEFRESFPALLGNLMIVVEGSTADLAEDGADRLASAMAQEPDLFKRIWRPGDDAFFRQNGLLFLSTEELEDLADNLADAQPILSQITQSPHLPGFFSMLNGAIEAAERGEDIDIAPLLEQVTRAVAAHNDNRFHELSWLALMRKDEPQPNVHRRVILVKPELEFSRWLAAGAVIDEVRRLARELSLIEEHGVTVHLTGPVALEYEELKSVSQGASLAGLLALAMVSVILIAALRSFRLVLACILTLVSGLAATAAFAAFAVGHLNLISIAFAVLYIGLGIDFAIHFSLRYRELIEAGVGSHAAIRHATQDVGASLVLCAVTTSIGFYAFFPTSFSGVSELGLISGTGMFISLAYTLTLLPALLTLMALRATPPKPNEESRRFRQLISMPSRHRRAILGAGAVLGLLSLATLPFVRFDSNPLNLRDPDSESVRTYRELLGDAERRTLTLSVLTESAESAEALAERLTALPAVDHALSLATFVPDKQLDKLNIINDLALILGPELMKPDESRQPDTVEKRRAVEQFADNLARWREHSDPAAPSVSGDLHRALVEFLGRLSSQAPADRADSLSRLEESLLGALPGRLARLRAALGAQPVTLEDLPESLVSQWRTETGRYRVEVVPKDDISNQAVATEFVRAVQAVAPGATGIPVVQLGAGRAVVEAFQQAFLFALGLISIVLLILMRSLRDTVLVITPLLLAASLTAGAAVLLKIPFNFANIIALPLLLGVGVDNGIHMVHRARTAPPDDGNLLATSTARAVLYSGLTTIASFGNLGFSQHVGTASMGKLLTLGMGFTLLCTLFLLPALLASRSDK